MGSRNYVMGFSGGEMSPEMFGRIDDGRFQLGLARCRNMIPRAQGTVRRRPGFQYCGTAKYGTRPTRVEEFVFNNDQAIAVEIGANYNAGTTATGYGHGYMRFWSEAARVTADSYAAWSNLTAYIIGDCVRYSNVNYYCILAHGASATTPDAIAWPTVGARWYAMPSGADDGILEIPTPFIAEDIFALTFDQSLDVMTFCHTGYFPYELRRYDAGTWALVTASLGAIISAPGSPAATATKSPQIGLTLISGSLGGSTTPYSTCFSVSNHGLANGDGIYLTGLITWTGSDPDPLPGDKWWQVQLDPTTPLTRFRLVDPETGLLWTNNQDDSDPSAGYIEIAELNSIRTNTYRITAVDSATNSESVASAEASVANNLNVEGSYNTVTWSSVTGADRYRVYKEESGLFGYIGETEDTTFRDDNIAPDMGQTPPILDGSFVDGTTNPGACGHYDQRRVFAGTLDRPLSFWFTRTGTENDLTYTLPVQDTNRIFGTISARTQGIIRHIVPLSQLVFLSSEAEYRITPINSDALTPGAVSARPQSHIGAAEVQPVVVNDTVLFAAARGGHVREMGWNAPAERLMNGDLSVRAAHLFDDYTIVDMALQKAPDQIVWAVSSNGVMLGCTYAPEEGVAGWHWHDTGASGLFKSVCCIPEGDEDRVYVVVQRTINGSTVQYIERMGLMAVTTATDAFYVDAGSTYTGVSTTSITGLTWLEDATVQVLGNGVVLDEELVASGAITISTASTTAHVGLGYTSEIQTLPLTMRIDGYGHGRQRNIERVDARVYESGDFQMGPSEDDLNSAQMAAGLTSDVVEFTPSGDWQKDAQLWIRQTNPLPLTVVSLTLEVATG